MSDHVVGHFSSSVRTPSFDWRQGRKQWALHPEQVAFFDDVLGASPTRVVTVGRRFGAPTDPADWRFREDGY